MAELRPSSQWDEAQIAAFLQTTLKPIRLACNDNNGVPLICSLWYLFDGEALWCATQESAAVTRYLRARPQVGFEVAPEEIPYKGVRGQAVVTIDAAAGEAVLRQLLTRYTGDCDNKLAKWLLQRADTEVALRIEPEWWTSWDFSSRM